MTLSFFAVTAFVNTVTSALLGSVVYVKNRHNEINKTFLYYCLSGAWWSISYFIWQVSASAPAALFWVHMLMVGAIMIPVLQTRFVRRILNLPKPPFQMFLLYLYVVVFQLYNWTWFFIDGVTDRGGFEFWPIAGPVFPYFLVVWVGIVLYNFVLLINGYIRSDSQRQRTQLLYIALATAVSYAGGMTNFPLWFNIPILPWGNISVSIYVVIVAYAIIRFRILNVKLMRAETLVFAVGLLLILDTLTATSVTALVSRAIIVSVFAIIANRFVSAVSDTEHLNAALKKDKARLEELDKLKDEFLAVATHELNTPIASIKGRLDMAIRENFAHLNKEQLSQFMPVMHATDRLAKLIANLLDISRIEGNRFTITPQEIEIVPLLTQSVEELEPFAKEHGVTFSTDFSGHATVSADPEKLRQALVNLLNNAVKFSDPGGIVTVHCTVHKGDVTIRIIDTGIGFTRAVGARLGHKFYQADRDSMEQQGSGLGLFITKHIITEHRGTLRLTSPGLHKGARAIITLPHTSA